MYPASVIHYWYQANIIDFPTMLEMLQNLD